MRYLILLCLMMAQAAAAQISVNLTATRDTTLFSEGGNL